jgi:hypothetical protein
VAGEKPMGDFLSFLYTVVDSLSLILFLDAFAERRWSDRKFTILLKSTLISMDIFLTLKTKSNA